jgi:F-type H+-transporting ATPase subunit delta
MANSYVDLYRKQNNITRGKLITAVPVSSEIEERMRKMVEQKTMGKVDFVTETDPEIVGGFILEYDTYRLDQSVSTQLRKTLQQFTNFKA